MNYARWIALGLTLLCALTQSLFGILFFAVWIGILGYQIYNGTY